jgi:four helix bundle protein
MKEIIIKTKSYAFAVRIVKLCQFLCNDKKEYVLSRQLLKCGTGVGALILEAEHAESKMDFKHKLSIAQKEINETIYWLDLLKETNYLNGQQYESIIKDATEIIKIITSIIKKIKLGIENEVNN